MKGNYIIAFLLLASMFWPFAYSQGMPSSSPSSGSAMSPRFCDIGGLGEVELTLDDVYKIQGIITQDVATSAENYKTQKALRELGETLPESGKIADRFHLYLMGPDGAITYSDVLVNSLQPNNGWLIGTTIFGRVEYGGLLGEDIPICPDMPTNKEGICNHKAGDEVQDVYSKDWTVATEVPNASFLEVAGQKIGQNAFNLATIGVETARASKSPFGTVNLGQSRIRAESYRVSLVATPGSQIFIIPKTYMYFVSRLKDLALMESVAQGALMVGSILSAVRNIRSGERLVKNKEKIFRNALDDVDDDIARIQRIARKGATADDLNDAIKIIDSTDTQLTGIINKLDDKILENSNLKKKFYKKLLGVDIDNTDDVKRLLERYKKHPTISEIDINRLDPEEARTLAIDIGLSQSPTDKATAIRELMADSTLNSRDKETLEGIIDTYEELAYRKEKIQKLSEEARTIKGLMKEASKDKEKLEALQTYMNSFLDDFNDAIKGEAGQAIVQTLSEQKLAIKKAMIGGKERTFARVLGLAAPEDKQVVSMHAQLLQEGRSGAINGARRLLGFKPTGIPITSGLYTHLAMLPGAFARGYLKALYYVVRPAVLTAYGLQLISELVMVNGYLEISPPGITVEWNKDTAGDSFDKQAYVIVKGTPTQIKGMYSSGIIGPLGSQELGEFLISIGADPILAGKYSKLGDYLAFGYDFNPNAYQKIITVEEEGRPTGITRIDKVNGGYLLRFMNWKQKGIIVAEDPSTMVEIGNKAMLSSVAMQTSGADIYAYIYGNPDSVKEMFPVTWAISQKLGDWGFLTGLVTAGTVFHTLPAIPRLSKSIGAFMYSAGFRGAFGAGRDLMVAKTTDMKSLETCVSQGTCERPSCEEVEARCEGELGAMSLWLTASGATQVALDYTGATGVLPALSFALGIADIVVLEGGIPLPGGGIKFFEGKMEKTDRCMKELLTCNERNFIIVGGQKIMDPNVLLEEQEKAKKVKGLPGLEGLPIEDFFKGFENQTSPVNIEQEQMNIHAEMENATGRLAFRNIYYVHLLDATIDWLASALPVTMCGLDANKNIDKCVKLQGNRLDYGNISIESDLIPFKWVDTELPAMIIPNTGVYFDLGSSTCAVFSVDSTGSNITFNPSIVSKFESLNFEDLERSFGKLRVINLDDGSIYPSPDIEGNIRLEFDRSDGSFDETNETVYLDATGNVHFVSLRTGKEETHTFRSAVFSGGTIVKQGDRIYILPRYFKLPISGAMWRELTKGKPFVSTTGEQLESMDELGNILGLNGSITRIPGGDKLGIITSVSAQKDINGDGVISDNETSGWRFYKVGNKSFFDLVYNGKKETYDGDQVEVDEDTGTIKVYEKGKPHEDQYLLRSIETKVDQLGRTLMTVKDGKGNTLLEDALITWIKGSGGSISYNPDTNNYVFVNGQPIELNNEFKTNGFNPITGLTDPPILQPSAKHGTKPWEGEAKKPSIPMVPTIPKGLEVVYSLALAVFITLVFLKLKEIKRS